MIEQLESKFEQFSETSRDIGKSISDSVSMLQLDEVQEAIASAVVEIEAVSNKTREKSFFEKIPGFGKLLNTAKAAKDAEDLKSGSMNEVVSRLFTALSAKKDNIISVSEMLFELKGRLQENVEGLVTQEIEVLDVITNGEGMEVFKAKNLLVQIQPTLIKAKDRIGVIDLTVNSAQVTAQKISAMLPNLHGDLVTEMAIQAGLQELQGFQGMFEATVDVVEELSLTNNMTMNKVLLQVADMAVNKPTAKALARIDSTNAERAKLSLDIKAKMQQGIKEREKALVVLADTRLTQDDNLLSFTPGKEV